MNIREKLLSLQKLSGMTQAELARRLGVTFVALNRWVNKKAVPRLDAEARIDSLYKEYSGQNQIPETVLAAKKGYIVLKRKKIRSPLKILMAYPDIYDAFILALTYHSNRIEGSTLSEGETAAILFRGASLPNRSLIEQMEVKNHQTALAYLFSRFTKDTSITETLVLKLHAVLLNSIRSDAGAYRRHGVRIVGSYVPTANYVRVPEKMRALLRDIQKKSSDITASIADVHARFEMIHPFSDGNGRVGRLLMVAMALREHIPPPIIHEQARGMYISCLQSAQLKNDTSRLEDFLCDAILDGYATVERKKKVL